MLVLQAQGWGAKRISKELGCSRNTVRDYLRNGGWKPMDVSGRASSLEPHRAWLEQRLRQHKGNADVVRQELQRELGIEVLRTVQRAVAPMRVALRAQALAHVRFETAPGLQLQVDFGSTNVLVGEEPTRIHLFVATLGYSRRTYVLLSLHERQSAWLLGLEVAFRHFGGVTYEVLVDNAKALVDEHNRQTREVKLNDRFSSFCSYRGVTPRACAPYRAQTKGKDERGVGYVKRNAIAGHTFASLDALQAHLDRWMREVGGLQQDRVRRGSAPCNHRHQVGCLVMPFFHVLLEGSNLCIPGQPGEAPSVGFFTTRVVWARGIEDAEGKALRSVKKAWEHGVYAKQPTSEQLKLRVSESGPSSLGRWLRAPNRGHVYFPED